MCEQSSCCVEIFTMGRKPWLLASEEHVVHKYGQNGEDYWQKLVDVNKYATFCPKFDGPPGFQRKSMWERDLIQVQAINQLSDKHGEIIRFSYSRIKWYFNLRPTTNL